MELLKQLYLHEHVDDLIYIGYKGGPRPHNITFEFTTLFHEAAVLYLLDFIRMYRDYLIALDLWSSHKRFDYSC